jgi:hypothetical protein
MPSNRSFSLDAFAVVVTDRSGMRFVRVKGNGHPTVKVLTEPTLSLVFRDIILFHDKNIAECYKKETMECVRRDFRGTKICPVPPLCAEVVPFSVKIGKIACTPLRTDRHL